MDITKLAVNDVELFALAYTIAWEIFGVEPITATATKQRKIRKWFIKNYVDGHTLPQAVLDFVDDAKSDREVLAFLAACAAQMAEQGARRRQRLEKALAGFPTDVKAAFTYLFETAGSCENVSVQEGQVVLTLGECEAYSRKLILHLSAENHVEGFDEVGYLEISDIVKEETGYRLVCMAEDFVAERSFPITVFFDWATVAIDIYRVGCAEFGETPWETLTSMACEILSKRDLGDGYFNQRETQRMPLIKELSGLALFSRLLEEEPPRFDLLRHYITQYRLPKIRPLLEKIEREYPDFNQRQRLLIRLHSKLNEASCEGLWRELYHLLAGTQSGYRRRIDLADQEKLRKIRTQLTQSFHRLGYEGEYPTFQKNRPMRGIKLEESYHLSYFIGFEKNVEHIIHCKESILHGQLQIQFLCGTALLRHRESAVDMYACCFNAKGRRLCKSVVLLEEDHTGRELFDRLGPYAQIAAKRAECTALTKSEHALLGDVSAGYKTFLLMLVFMGGLFAVGMTASMMILVALITALAEGCAAIPETFTVIPWWHCFLFCFFGAGVPMAVIETRVKRK